MLNWKVVVAVLLGFSFIVVVSIGQSHWNKQLEIHSYQLEQQLPSEKPRYVKQTATDQEGNDQASFISVSAEYDDQFLEILTRLQQEMTVLLTTAENEYYQEVVTGEQEFKNLLNHYASEANLLQEQLELEYVGLCNQLSEELVEQGLAGDDVYLYYSIFQESARNLQMNLVAAIISLQN